jgi:hypothetical protein
MFASDTKKNINVARKQVSFLHIRFKLFCVHVRLIWCLATQCLKQVPLFGCKLNYFMPVFHGASDNSQFTRSYFSWDAPDHRWVGCTCLTMTSAILWTHGTELEMASEQSEVRSVPELYCMVADLHTLFPYTFNWWYSKAGVLQT